MKAGAFLSWPFFITKRDWSRILTFFLKKISVENFKIFLSIKFSTKPRWKKFVKMKKLKSEFCWKTQKHPFSQAHV